MQDFFKDYDTTYEMRISWVDMNAALHVDNVTYLYYAETARMAYFTDLDFIVRVNEPTRPIGPIFAQINCKYKAPLSHPDTITIATRINRETLDEYSFWIEQIIVSHQQAKIAAEIEARVVSYDYVQLKKAPLPEYFLRNLNNKV